MKENLENSLRKAIEENNEEYVEQLLALFSATPTTKAPFLGAVDNAGNSFLHLAIQLKHFPIAQQLIKALVKKEALECLRVVNFSRQNLIWEAARSGSKDILRELADKGVNVDEADINHVTPLMMAAESGWVENIQLLLERSASMLSTSEKINLADNQGNTALFYACKNLGADKNAKEVAEFLVRHGADYAKRNFSGQTCFSLLHNQIPSFPELVKDFMLYLGENGAFIGKDLPEEFKKLVHDTAVDTHKLLLFCAKIEGEEDLLEPSLNWQAGCLKNKNIRAHYNNAVIAVHDERKEILKNYRGELYNRIIDKITTDENFRNALPAYKKLSQTIKLAFFDYKFPENPALPWAEIVDLTELGKELYPYVESLLDAHRHDLAPAIKQRIERVLQGAKMVSIYSSPAGKLLDDDVANLRKLKQQFADFKLLLSDVENAKRSTIGKRSKVVAAVVSFLVIALWCLLFAGYLLLVFTLPGGNNTLPSNTTSLGSDDTEFSRHSQLSASSGAAIVLIFPVAGCFLALCGAAYCLITKMIYPHFGSQLAAVPETSINQISFSHRTEIREWLNKIIAHLHSLHAALRQSRVYEHQATEIENLFAPLASPTLNFQELQNLLSQAESHLSSLLERFYIVGKPIHYQYRSAFFNQSGPTEKTPLLRENLKEKEKIEESDEEERAWDEEEGRLSPPMGRGATGSS